MMTLVPNEISHDTVEALGELHRQAQAGEVTGLAYVAMRKRKGYLADTAGAAHRNPTYALGALMVLASELTHRIRGK